MRQSKFVRWFGLLTLIFILLGLALPLQARTFPVTQAQNLQAAWRLASSSDHFHYQTQVLQTTHPETSLRNANRHTQSQQFQVEGEIDRPAQTMLLQLRNHKAGHEQLIDLKIEDGQAYGRLNADADWTPLDQSTDLFAPGGDPLGFLVAAKNVEVRSQKLEVSGQETVTTTDALLANVLPPDYLSSLTRYHFDLDGVQYAEFMRAELQKELQRKGELPNGVNLGLLRQYVDMTGSGEIWVNAQGLPIRQVIHMQFPPEQPNGEWAEAEITSNFSAWQSSSNARLIGLWQQPSQIPQTLLQMAGITYRTLEETLLSLVLLTVIATFAVLIILLRRTRLLYVGLMALIIASTLVVPLLQAQQLYAFSERQQNKVALDNDERATQEQIEAQQAEHAGRTSNPEINPLDKSAIRNPQYESANQQTLVSYCNTTTNTDCDGDGLSNDVEVNKLGTNPYSVDSDNDYISDGVEVKGFTFGGKQWYLDPLNPDSNGDGLIDSLECPGLNDINLQTDKIDTAYVSQSCLNNDSTTANSDSVPDVFDFDNDGDGVPDNVDDSPYSVVGNTSSGVTNGKLSFNLNFTGAGLPIYVDFTVRPTNSKHLWYTNNVLDWPSNDTQGQVTRVFDTTYADNTSYSSLDTAANGDMLLVPLLELQIPYNAANPSAGLPISGTYSAADIHDYSNISWLDTTALSELGITANEGEDGKTLLLWIPLTEVQDETGDAPVAWSGRMLYRPDSGLSNLGSATTVRLIWMVEALIDSCDTSSLSDAADYDTWCADHSHWTTSNGIIQTYYDNFTLTGLSAREDHGGKIAIIAEPNGVGNSHYEDHLWHMADSLEQGYLGAQAKSNGSRLGVDDFATFASTWGVGDLSINVYPLADELDLATVASTYSTAVLQNVYPSAAVSATTTLLFAGEETARNTALSDSATTISGNAVTLDLRNATLDTTGDLRWAPYQYKGAGVWDAADLESYLTSLDDNLQASLSNSQLDWLVNYESVADYSLVRSGASALAQSYYLALYTGVSKTLAENGSRYSTDSLGNYALGSSDPVATIVKRLLGEIQSYYGDLSLIDALTTTSNTTAVANSLAASFAVSLTAILEAFGNVVQGNSNSALSLALSELANYYKTTDVDTTSLTSVGSLTAVAWSSMIANLPAYANHYDLINFANVSYIGAIATSTYLTLKAGMSVYTVVWGIKAYNSYSASLALANFTHLQPGGNPTAALTYAAKADQVVKANIKWSLATLVATTVMIWALFVFSKYDNHLQRNAAIAKAIGETVVAVIMAVLTAIPVIGWAIAGVIALIDVLMMSVCAIIDVPSGSTVDVWVCGGLTGALSQAITYLIYDQYIVPNLNDKDRLLIALNTPTLVQNAAEDGYVAGNQLQISATVTNTLSKSKPTGLGSLEHLDFDLNDLLKQSTFTYTLQSGPIDHHASLHAKQTTWSNNQAVFHPALAVDFDQPGLNQNLPLYLTESFQAPTLECWGFLIQVCQRSDYKDSFHTYLGEDIAFDILPATLDEFYTLSAVGHDSYRLGWDTQFPTLLDADGDGLISELKGGSDPNDSLWDTDGDGLSDYWELTNGFNPEASDADGDGLYDYWEAFYDTNPNLADSDSDGLSDGAEFFHSGSKSPYSADSSTWSGGWSFVYGYSGSNKLQTLVNADPNDYDSDDDTISDRLELAYGYNPNLASVLNLLSLDAEVSSTEIAPNASLAYTATVKNELDNRVANGLLQAEFPVDTVQKTQVMETLYPQDSTTLKGTVTAPSVSSTTATSLTLRAGAIIDEVDTGHVLWLHLNESSGSSFADDAQTNNGPHNATCSGNTCPSANGSFLTFDGSDDLLTIADHDELDQSFFTLSLWTNLSTAKAQTLFAKGTTGLNLKTSSDGKVTLSLTKSDCTTPVSFQTSGALPTNSWQNLIVTYDGTTLTLYLNGINSGSAVLSSICTNSSAITLGQSLKGQIDEVELYTSGMTSSEVATLFKKPVFYLSSYHYLTSGTYWAKDDADFGVTTVTCQNNPSKDLDCPDQVSTVAGNGFSFNQWQGLKVSGSDILDPSLLDDTFSMSLWLYPQSGYTPDDDHLKTWGQMLIGYDEDGLTHAYPSLYIKDKRLMVRFGHADEQGYCEATSDEILSYDTWQYLTVTFDQSQFKVYRNGSLVSTFSGTSCAGQPLHAGDDFYIGHGRSPAIYFNSLEVGSGAKDDEAFLWSDDTLLNNGYGSQSVVWESAANVLDGNTTVNINQWAWTTEPAFGFILCNEDDEATLGCTGGNDNDTYKLANGDYSQIHNFYDSLGSQRLYVRNTHGSNKKYKDWDGYLNYDLYSDGFKGMMDEIKLYRAALTADEAAVLYAGSVRSSELTFDEAPGQDIFSDGSGNGYDGTCSSKSCPDSGIPGRFNQAARFDGGVSDDDGYDGVGDYITLQSASNLGLKDGSFTVLAWIKPDSVTGDRAILGTDRSQTQQGLHLILRNGKPYFGFYNIDTTGNSTIPTGKWTHLAWRYDKDNLTQSIFVNGVSDATGLGKAPFTGTDPVLVGRALGGNYFDGLIDHLVIVKAALTDDEILDIMQEAPTLNLHLDEDLTATSFANDSPYGNAATCSGTACPQAGSKGQVRESPVFDGNDLLTSDLTGYVGSLPNISVGFWVKPTQTKSTVQYLWQSDPFNLFLKANSTDLAVDVGYYFGSVCYIGSTADLTTVSLQKNQWNHVLVTMASTATPYYTGSTLYYNQATLTVYLNGVVQTSATKNFTCPSLSTVKLGQSFEGGLDEFLLYNDVQTAQTVKSLYAYQNAWYDLTYQQLITIDADKPQVEIAMNADYLAQQPYWFTITAVDTDSSVQQVQVKLTRPNNTVSTSYATASTDSESGNAWLYEFIPTMEGKYTLNVTATDAVGNTSSSASKTFYVDNTAPTISLSSPLSASGLTTAASVDTDTLRLSGQISDPGSAASGVVSNSVSLNLLDHAGVSVAGSQFVTVTGTTWQIDYPFTLAPYGQYSVTMVASDLAGNSISTTVGTLAIDDLAPVADLALNSSVISESVSTLNGVVTDIPYPGEDRALALHFEENAGATSFIDTSNNGLSITCTNCPTAGGSGASGKAASFDGVNDALTLSSLFDPASSKFTVMTWFKVNKLGSQHTLIAQKAGTGTARTWLLLTSDGKLASDLGGSRLSSTETISSNQWHHSALTYDGTTLHLYLDGTLTAQADRSLESSDGEIVLGADGTLTQNFLTGSLDEMLVYQHALRDEEIYDIAHPLNTSVSSAAIRFRHAKDSEQGLDEGSWYTVTLTSATGNFTSWQYPLPNNLEGPYKIDMKANDSLGNSNYIPNIWSGEIDTLAPRVSFTYTLLNDQYMQVACLADDYNITLDGWLCPSTPVNQVQNSDTWFVNLFAPLTRTVSLQTPLATVARQNNPASMTACDQVGHCATQTITNPQPAADASVVITPNPGLTVYGLDSVSLAGYIHSTHDLRALTVTLNGSAIYTLAWTSGVTETAWSTSWKPTQFGSYKLVATMSNGQGQSFSDPVETIVTVIAPELSITKTVKPTSYLRTGDAITYTVVVANIGNATAQGVILSDTLPSFVSGNNLSTTLDIAAGQTVSYTIPAVVQAGESYTITNQATVSHTWQQRSSSATFARCDYLLVTNANDSGSGSLRQAISDACTNDPVVHFAGDFNIYLNSTLSINKPLTIDGGDHTILLSGDSNNDGSRNVQLFKIGSSGDVTLTHLQVVSGSAGSGGGIYNDGSLTISNSRLADNASTGSLGGGAIYSSKQLTINRSTLSNNQAIRGGALALTGAASVVNSTFANNSANEGGAILSRGSVTLTHVTIANNSAGTGGGLHNQNGTLSLYNTLIANNSTADCKNSGTLAVNLNNLIRTGNCAGNFTGDALLSILGNYGGDQPTLALLPGSAALDNGNSATCEASDQRGLPRHGQCDIGAFESQGITFTLQSGDGQETWVNRSFAQPLIFGVRALAASEPISGGKVYLSAPSSGASLSPASLAATLDAGGVVSQPISANGRFGNYTVTATIGAANADFLLSLANLVPDLVIEETVTPTSAIAGDLINYTLRFSNTGQIGAESISITDTLPSGVTVQNISSSGDVPISHTTSSTSYEGFALATLGVGQSGLITITARLSDTLITGNILTNSVAIRWPESEKETSNNQVSVSLTIPCQWSIVVLNDQDRGAGSLRQALSNLCDGGAISFANDATIYLNSTLNLSHTLTIDGSGHSVTLSGDSGNNGSANVQPLNIATSSVITLRNLNVVSGTAIYGGAIYNAGTLHLSNAKLNGNLATSNGGAIYNVGGLNMTENVTLQGNRASRGGALYSAGNLTLAGLTLHENSASEGGALYNAGTLTLTALVLQNNSATNSGGAFYNAGWAIVENTTFASNRATDGTLYNAGSLLVTASTFAANNVTRGGGLYNTTGYTATVTNSTFANNSAGEGGGIHNRGVLTVTNSSIANNGGYGSSLHNWNGTLHLRNSLLAGSCVNQGTLATNQNNLIESGNCNPAYTGPANVAVLGNYGGNSQTVALLTGSMAIDHADPIYCPTLDQRGMARTGTCDIGAFESQGFQMLYVGGSDQTVDAGLAFAQPLQISVTANVSNEPIGGSINLFAPSEGAGLNSTSNQVTIDSNGLASLTVTANRLAGSYVVTATANGVTSTTPITFALTNQPCVGAVVSNANDSGAGSLRHAINQVCPGGTITFSNDFTIQLHSTLLISDTANNPVTIDGSGHKIVISGDSNGDGTPALQPLVIGASKSVTLTHLQVLSGTASSGSAIYNGGTLALDTVTLAHHIASSNDSNNNGTLYNVGTLTVRNSTFAHNETYHGGGIYNRSGTAVVSNSTFAENVAPEGGGIFNRSVLTVTNSTFAENTTNFGEGIYNSGSLYLINSLLKGKSSVAANCSGNAAILRLNSLSDDSSCGSASRSNRVRLLSLADQGGTATGSESNVETAVPATGSSAIDAGNAAYCPNLDQRGKQRLGNCDVGAVEWQGYHLAINSGDEQHSGILNDFAQPLQVTLNALESGDSVPSGSVITFSAPISGASLSNSGLTAATDGSQRANLSVIANDVIGTYWVTATARYVTTPVTFTLHNECGLATVHNDHNSGPGSLRQAISDTCDSGVVSFDGDYSIYLESTLSISKTITVDAAGHKVVLSGDTGNDGSPDLRVLAIEASGAVTLSHLSIVSGTVSGEDGAAIQNEGKLTLLASTLAGHVAVAAPNGGAGAALNNLGTATIVNSTFANNVAEQGGAISNRGTMYINNSTLVANSANVADGLYNEGDLGLSNTLIANGGSGGDCANLGTFSANQHNLIEDSSCRPDLSGDPKIASVQNYGGETPTVALLPGSPAIDAGEVTSCASEDQRDIDRVGPCDIGAFESQGFAWSISGGDNAVAPISTPFAQPLQVTMVASDTHLSLADQLVTFTAPDDGASLAAPSTVLPTNAAGVAAATVTANAIFGHYTVTATAEGFDPLVFQLKNDTCFAERVVTNNSDHNPGSLREALEFACDGAIITFSQDVTITLESGLTVNKPVTIDGGDHMVVLDGNNNVRPLEFQYGAVVTLSAMSVVNGWSSDFGGAINNNGDLTLVRITLAHNHAGWEGGGVYNTGNLTIRQSTIRDNEAETGGGFSNYELPATIVDSTFSHNHASFGGAIYNAMTLFMTSTTVSGNTADYYGGGIHSFADLWLFNSTISDNQSETGGGIEQEGSNGEGDEHTLTMVNTIIANSINGVDCSASSGAIIVDNGHNLIEDGSCLTDPTSLSGDPWLAPLANYGGESETHALLPNSAVIDVGDASQCPTTDQRGETRLGTCDIGAFESQGYRIEVSGGNEQAALLNTQFAEPLQATLVATDSNLSVGEGQLITFSAPERGASLDTAIITGVTNASGMASITVTANGVAGTYPLTATASHATNTANFVLYNSRDNHAPMLDPVADQTIRENHPLSFTVTASDSDSDPLTLSLSDLPFGATFDANTGLFTWTPTVAQGLGSYTLTVTVTDNGTPALRDSAVVKITVLDVPLAFDQAIATKQNQSVDLVLVGSAVNEPISYSLATSPTHGTLSGTLPDLTYTPETDFVGNDAFTFLVSDGLVESAAATFSITVNPVDDTGAAGDTNHVPIASSEVMTTEEDTALAVDLDTSDLDGDLLTYTIQSNVQNGLLGGIAPHLIYTPDANYAGEDNFTVVVSDGISNSVEATISLVIVPVNDVPTANDQLRTIDEDQSVALLLTGDDIDNDVLIYTVSTQPLHGALGGIAPKLIYTPATDFNGNDSFIFVVSDELTQSTTATVSLTVKPVNDAPNAIAQDVHTAEDIPLSITVAGLDVDGDDLNYSLVTQPRYGMLGSVVPHLIYTPAANFAGNDAFIFAVNDGAVTSTAMISITVDPANDAPVANPQSVGTIEDGEILIVLTGDDVDGDLLTYTLISQPMHGQLNGNAPNLTYVPDDDFNGGDSFAFSVSDGLTSSLTATVSILVDPVNDVPTTNAQSISTEEDTPIAITLSGSDPDDDALTYSILSTPLHGLLGGIAPHLIYTPTSNYSGSDRFTFQVNDGTADSALTMVEITVAPLNDEPIAESQTITTSEDLPVAISVTGNDIDSDVLTYTLLTSPTHGTLNGIAPFLRYTPTVNFSGDDSFTFVISDGITNSTVATVIVQVTPVNDLPVAYDQFLMINEEQPVTITLTARDEDGDALVYALTTEPIHGSLSGAAPNLVYTPAADFNGSDVFSFRVSDGVSQSQVATVTMSVMPINDPPTAEKQTLTTHEETPISVTLLATDPDSTVLTYTVVAPPSNGALAGVAPNLLYTPNSDFASSDAFSFVVSDGIGQSTLTTVSIMVEPVNDAPLVRDLNVTTSEETAVAITLAGNDPDGDELGYVVGTKPHHGVLGGVLPNLAYTPTTNFNGNDSFTYWVSDGVADSLLATVLITITSVNDAPLAMDQSYTDRAETPITLALSGVDVDGDVLSYTIMTQPLSGTVGGVAPSLVYTPTDGFAGVDTLTFAVNDGQLSSAAATITITVVPTNHAPTAEEQQADTDEDTNLSLILSGADPDGDALAYWVVGKPQHGKLIGTAPTLLYAPNDEYHGADSFSFVVSDSITNSQIVTVFLTINSINDPPVAADQEALTDQQSPLTITLFGDDIESDVLTYHVQDQPQHGRLDDPTSSFGQSLRYTPDDGFAGSDRFTYLVNDGLADSQVATVTIVVMAVEGLSTSTPTPTATPTSTPTPSQTPTATATATATSSPTPTQTATASPTGTLAPTVTSTHTATPSPTNMETSTPSPVPTSTSSSTVTMTPSHMATPSPTNTETSTPSLTPTSTASETPTPTASPIATPTVDPAQLSFRKTVGIVGIQPDCTELSVIKLPRGSQVRYCYTVVNTTDQALQLGELVDSHLGLLLPDGAITLLPGEAVTHTAIATLWISTTNVATWTVSLPTMDVSVASAVPVSPVITSATVIVSSDSDDQDLDLISDNVEQATDFDGDNIPNFLDTDSDSDLRPDIEEGTLDRDQDQQMDFLDPDNPTNSDDLPEPTGASRVYLPLVQR